MLAAGPRPAEEAARGPARLGMGPGMVRSLVRILGAVRFWGTVHGRRLLSGFAALAGGKATTQTATLHGFRGTPHGGLEIVGCPVGGSGRLTGSVACGGSGGSGTCPTISWPPW